MYFAGIDVGSRTGKIVVLGEDGELLHSYITETVRNAVLTYEKLIESIPEELSGKELCTLATGYGRVALEPKVDYTATEITCHFLGVRRFFPKVGTIVDIGGQDSKVITVENDTIRDFAMNDRCAAGTGRFLEVMVGRLGYTMEEFCDLDMEGIDPVPINATCTVFAESEVVGLMATDTDPRAIVASIARMAASNIGAMIRRLHADPPVVMTGGVSKIGPVRYFLEKLADSNIMTHEASQLMGAWGAALLSRKKFGDDHELETVCED